MAETYFFKEKKDRNFTVLDNCFIRDETITWKSKGVMTYLLSLPEDWKIHITEITNHSSDGIAGLRSAIKELIEHGYIQYERKRNDKGVFTECIYKIIENPHIENPHVDKPYVDNPHVENRTLLNTNNTKDLLIQNNNNTNTAPEKEHKHKHGTYNNVLLSDKEVEKLKNDYGEEKFNKAVEYLSSYKEEKGYKTKSDNLTMRRWVFDAVSKNPKKPYQSANTNFINRSGENNNHDYSKDAGAILPDGTIGF